MGSTSSGAAGASGRCNRAIASGSRDLGDVPGAGLQPAQRADHRPGDEQRGQERDDEDRRDDDTGRDGLPLRVRTQLAGGAHDLVQQADSTSRMACRYVVAAEYHCCASRSGLARSARAVTLSSSRLTASTAWPLTSASYGSTWLGGGRRSGSAAARRRRSARAEENCCCCPNWKRPPARRRRRASPPLEATRRAASAPGTASPSGRRARSGRPTSLFSSVLPVP